MIVEAAALHECAARMLDEPILHCEPVVGGANNRMFRLTARSATYALKAYPTTPGDSRDRFATEANALRFVQRILPASVPRLIAVDHSARIIISEWIDGERVDANDKTAVADVLGLLAGLHTARSDAAASSFGLASEACVSATELYTQLQTRRARLGDIAALADVLLRFDRVCERVWQAVRPSERSELRPEFRTLSASDFGFHNALRRAHRLVFFDLEYFGWDDPVKAVSDFVWHPAMTLDATTYHQFLTQSAEIYKADSAFCARLKAHFPMYGLRWSLIVLNEFLPERWARRVAAGQTEAHAVVAQRQRAKALALLTQVEALIERAK